MAPSTAFTTSSSAVSPRSKPTSQERSATRSRLRCRCPQYVQRRACPRRQWPGPGRASRSSATRSAVSCVLHPPAPAARDPSGRRPVRGLAVARDRRATTPGLAAAWGPSSDRSGPRDGAPERARDQDLAVVRRVREASDSVFLILLLRARSRAGGFIEPAAFARTLRPLLRPVRTATAPYGARVTYPPAPRSPHSPHTQQPPPRIFGSYSPPPSAPPPRSAAHRGQSRRDSF